MAIDDISLLKRSSQGRSGAPNGNIFFDVATGNIQIITREELATVDFGAGPVPNPITNVLGVTLRALYAFERQERAIDDALQKYEPYFKGTFKFGGAYEIINGRKFAASDRSKVRSSGWIERAVNGQIDRIYFGVRSLNNINVGSQPYYQLSSGGAPVNFSKLGPINEAIQVFGTTANGDAGAGNFDSRTYLAIHVRTFGQTFDKKVLADSGITTMDGYAAGFALGEASHPTSGAYNLADVYGGARIAPFTGLSVEQFGAPQVRGGFINTGSGTNDNFTYILHNTLGASLDQCVAYLDAIAQTDNDVDAGAGTINGKRVDPWYSYDQQGRVVTRVGLHIDNIPESDKQRIVQQSNTSALRSYPFNVEVRVNVGAFAAADPNSWYRAVYKDGSGGSDFNTSGAVTLTDAFGSPVKGLVSAKINLRNEIVFSYAYDSNTEAGLAASVDKDVIFICEGDGIATQKQTEFKITRSTIVSAACEPGSESNI